MSPLGWALDEAPVYRAAREMSMEDLEFVDLAEPCSSDRKRELKQHKGQPLYGWLPC
jgi:hypothetical protein